MIVVKVPYENSFDDVGCGNAADKILENFSENYVSEFGNEVIKSELDIKELDLKKVNEEEGYRKIYDFSLKLLEKEKCFFLGGDNSINYPIGKAFLDNCQIENKSPFLIVFDAHLNVKPSGNIPNNRQWLWKLLDAGFPKENIILIGTRIFTKEEKDFLDLLDIKRYGMKDLNDYQEICDIIMELSRENEIYLSIDIDVVDGSFVPGTSRPESAGFTARQLIYFIQRLSLLRNLRAVSLSEININKDINLQTVKLGSKILGEVLGNKK